MYRNLLVIVFVSFIAIGSAKFAPNHSGSVDVEIGNGQITNIVTNGDFVIAAATPNPSDSNQTTILSLIYPFKLTVIDQLTVPDCSSVYIEFFHKTKAVLLTQSEQNYALYEMDLSIHGFNITKALNFTDSVAVYTANSLVRTDRNLFYISSDENDQSYLYRIHLDDEVFNPIKLTNLTQWIATNNLNSFVISPDNEKVVLAVVHVNEIVSQLVSVNITTGIADASALGLWYEIGYDMRASGVGYGITYNPNNQNLSFFEQWNFEELSQDPLVYAIPLYQLHAQAHSHSATFLVGVLEVIPVDCANNHVGSTYSVVAQVSYTQNKVWYLCDLPFAQAVGADDFHAFVSTGNATVFNYRVL